MKSLHTCIRVKDLEKSVMFYQDVFGYEETRRRDFPEAEFTLVYLSLPGEEYELELTYNYDRKEPYNLGDGYGHMAIGVDDLKAIHKELKNEGHNITDLSGLTKGTFNYFFITDPDGYKIELIQL